MIKKLVVTSLCLAPISANIAWADTSSELDLLKKKISEQQAQIESLADSIERATTTSNASQTTLGGYGELHYNNLNNQLDGQSDKKEIDLHRFVLMAEHKFDDNLKFYSELEVEHSLAGEGKKGEVAIEQSFIDWRYAGEQFAQAGIILMPVGFLNKTHEPETFYGVERNPVEKNIIPTTWSEGGLGFHGEIVNGFSYEFDITSGLKLSDGKYKVRDGRQAVSKAPADNLAYTLALAYRGLPGLEIAGTLHRQTDLLQGQTMNGAKNISATLAEFHSAYRISNVTIKALYASWFVDSDIEKVSAGADRQTGYYIEPSLKITPKLGIFTRFGQWDNNAGNDGMNTKYQQIDLGANYWINERVVVKVDYQNQNSPSQKSELNGVNLGLGWSF